MIQATAIVATDVPTQQQVTELDQRFVPMEARQEELITEGQPQRQRCEAAE